MECHPVAAQQAHYQVRVVVALHLQGLQYTTHLVLTIDLAVQPIV